MTEDGLPQDNPLVYALSLTLFRVTFNHTKEPVESRYEPEVPTTFVLVDLDACDAPGVGDISGRNLEKIGGAGNLISVTGLGWRERHSGTLLQDDYRPLRN
ncbi:MAG: hypothetical protein PHI12_01715 [Dehalococcoidales bacterium]|nr:hypothetical protein [Dehalococcoidales bacterium]